LTTYATSLSRLCTFGTCAAALTTLLACAPALADDAAPAAAPGGPWTITKHIDLASRYVLRGVTTTYGNGQPLGNAGADAPESDQAALQWGIDFVHSSGWSFGYWASTINYSYKQLGNSYSDRSITEFQKPRSVENDLYFAYTGNISGDLGYTLGMTGYYYANGSHANALETKAGLTWGALSFNAQTLLNDVVWGNKGDTYWTLVYTKPLPYDITFTGRSGLTPTAARASTSAPATPPPVPPAARARLSWSMAASPATAPAAVACAT
jgi:uncharacterized protein (TIGR02001 family)